jgi:phage tail sheath gpL-like
VNLKPTAIAPGSQILKGLIVGPPNVDGNIDTADEIRELPNGQADMDVAAGVASLPSLAYAALIAQYPQATIEYIGVAPSGGDAATGSFTFGGAATTSGTCHFKIQGVAVDVPWNVGDTLNVMRAKAVTYLGQYSSLFFATCTEAVTEGVVTVTANQKGPAGNDVSISCTLEGVTGGTMTVSAAHLAAGTTEPDFTLALAAAEGKTYDFIGLCLSNADAASTTGNFAKLKTHIASLNEGNGAKLQQGIVGHTGLRTALSSAAAAMNEQWLEMMNVQNALSLPCQVMGDEMGSRMAGVAAVYSKNRIGSLFKITGSADPVGDNPTTAQSDAALLDGVSLAYYDSNNDLAVCRAITTYVQTPTGASILPTDCNEIDAMYVTFKDLRLHLQATYKGVRVARDSDDPADQLPEGVVEERDIKATVVARLMQFAVPKGLINKTALLTEIEAGNLVVSVDDVDETQVNVFVPVKPYKNLAKMGLCAQKTG